MARNLSLSAAVMAGMLMVVSMMFVLPMVVLVVLQGLNRVNNVSAMYAMPADHSMVAMTRSTVQNGYGFMNGSRLNTVMVDLLYSRHVEPMGR